MRARAEWGRGVAVGVKARGTKGKRTMVVCNKLTIVHHVVEELEGVLAASATTLLALGHDVHVHVGRVGDCDVLALGLDVELAQSAICDKGCVLDVDVACARRVLDSEVPTKRR